MKFLPLSMGLLLASAMVLADDGPIFRKNISGTEDLETEHATIRMLPVYVPAQSTAGDPVVIEYVNAEGSLVETREYARPLIAHYNDGAVEFIEEDGYGGFPGHGQRDAYAAVSLDDGATWKRTNLSKSGTESSIRLRVDKKWVPYYGDVLRTFAASDGNKVLITWVSKYCGSGSPAYAMSDAERELLAPYLEGTGTIENADACTDADPQTPCTYLEDVFGVGGSQGVQDEKELAEDGYPLVGDYPFSCAWAARGVLLPPGDDGLSRFSWFKAERLSSGVRDANRPEAVCVKGAGCVVTWQEDPEGIRPGHGDGPGEGWSGAIAHHQTDTWYSFIDWDDFGLVSEDGEYGTFYNGTGDLAEWAAANDSGSPKAAVPMSIPVRLTDNAMCTGDDLEADTFTSKAYCGIDFDESGAPDFCATTETVNIVRPDLGPDPVDIEMCVTEDGRLMRGNTASTRARLGLHGYSTLGDYSADPAAYPVDSAWFYMAYEENKGLGDICDDGDCDDEDMTDADKRDMGKNVWYHTFDMFHPELVSQGLMLNQPAVYPDDWSDPTPLLEASSLSGYNFFAFKEDPIYLWQAGLTTTTLYQTEIARRPSNISQDWYDAGPSGLVGFQLWKQGIVRRGGPADIMARRFVIPADGGEGGSDSWQLCTTTYEVCTTTFDWCEGCEPNIENPDYDYNKGQCKKDPTAPRCFAYYYIDENDDTVYTNEPENCPEEPVCYFDEPSCPEGQTCDETTLCESDPPLDSCPVDEVCEATTECGVDTGGICPDGMADNQQCTLIPGGGGTFNPATDNPYDYANMECLDAAGNSAWYFTDGSNPRYVKGLCAAPAINLSANTVLEGEFCSGAEACFDAFPFNDYFDDIQMDDDPDSPDISKILTWQMYGPGYGETINDTALTNLDDTSWENPYDMAKGHRGFLAGDMVMMMYGWTNNWKALSDAHDIINLYVRRSFDGGLTWSTLPSSFTHTNGLSYSGDGTTTCEWMGETGSETEYPVCTTYGAGEFEQARNVSQLLGHQVTVLDPRFSPTTRSITEASVSTDSLPAGFVAPLYDDDTRDPSRFFMVYETGQTSAYDAGEAIPLDLFYSRAVDWGDDYLVWQDEADTSACIPSAENTDLAGFCNEFDALEGSQFSESGEAAVTASPGGQFFYGVWNQWDFDHDDYLTGADAWFRRVLFLDDYVPPE